MSNKAVEEAKARIADLVNAGKGTSAAMLRAYLTIEEYRPKDIDAALKASGKIVPKGDRSDGFREALFDYIVEERRTKQEVEAFIEGTGAYGETSTNVRRHTKAHLDNFLLSERVRDAIEREQRQS